jgi:hypothetical protein
MLTLKAHDSRVKGQAAPTNDPLAGLPFMRLFRQCVYAARIGNQAKSVLIRIADEVDGDGRSGSISYAKLAYDLELDERTVKRIVKKFKDVWLHVQRCGGRLVPGVGRENMYHVMAPPSVVDTLREHRLANLRGQIAGVVSRHPDPAKPGWPQATRTGADRAEGYKGNRESRESLEPCYNSRTRPAYATDEWWDGRWADDLDTEVAQ